jgi:hypothetical protein
MGKKTITARPVIVRSNTSLIINQLNYTYYSDSNKLKAVTDAVNDNNSTLGDFKFTKKHQIHHTHQQKIGLNGIIQSRNLNSAAPLFCKKVYTFKKTSRIKPHKEFQKHK